MESKTVAFPCLAFSLSLAACLSGVQPVPVDKPGPVEVPLQQPLPVPGFPTVDWSATQPPGATGTCANPYIPVLEGATWTSAVSFGPVSMTQVDTITDVGTDAFLVETKAGDTSVLVTWTCTPGGVLWLQSNGGMFSAVSQDLTWSTSSFSGVTIPAALQPGDTWSSSQEMVATGAGGSQSFTINIDYRAVGAESVTVPAGTFDAMRIDFVMRFAGPDTESAFEFSDWFVKDLGLVMSTAQQTTGGSLDFRQELLDYSIP